MKKRLAECREQILEELRFSQKVIGAGKELTARFIVYSPTGCHVVSVPLPLDDDARAELFKLVRLFMVWKAATAFILSAELNEPDAILSVFVSRSEVLGAQQDIIREPLTFLDPIWIGRERLTDDILSVLPPKRLQLSKSDLQVIKDFEDGAVRDITWFTSEV